MGGGPKNVTSTTETTPPDFLVGPLTGAANAAQGQFAQSGGPGSEITGNSQQLINDTIQGKFLDPSTNPFLQSTFDRAAQLTRGRLLTEFGTNNRDLVASAPARSEELQNLAGNIFGGNFQQERGRQQAAVSQGERLDPLNMLINRLAGIIPGAGGSTQSTQPVFRTGLFG